MIEDQTFFLLAAAFSLESLVNSDAGFVSFRFYQG